MSANAYIDDSGSDPSSPECVVAGFVATAEVWERFSDQWHQSLRLEPRIEFFKMSEAESLKGQFTGWSTEQRDKKVIALAQVILQAKPLLLDAVIPWTDYKKIVLGRVLKDIDHPFFTGFHTVIAKMAHEKQRGQYLHVVDFVFDHGSPFADAAVTFYTLLRKRAEEMGNAALTSSLGATPIFRNDKQVLPLQAADMLAWQIRRQRDQTLPENSNPNYMRPVLHLLDQLVKFDMLLGERELMTYVDAYAGGE